MFCREQAARFQDRAADFEEAGARLVAIGNGTPAMASHFAETQGLRFDVFTNPGLEAYRHAGMKRRLGLGVGTFKRAARALAGGHLQGRTRGDALQQGGVMVVTPEGAVPFFHADDEAGELVAIERVLAALPP